MNTESLSVVLAGGGTAGHISPLLAIAAAIRDARPDARLLAVGTPPAWRPGWSLPQGLNWPPSTASRFRASPPLDLLRLPGRLAGAVQAGRAHPRRRRGRRPGGRGRLRLHAHVPGRLAAENPHRHPRGQHPPGLANRVGRAAEPARGRGLRRHAAAAARATSACPCAAKSPAWTGQRPRGRQPVRPLDLQPDKPALIVTGGSSGAQSINRTVAASLGALRRGRRPDPAHHRPRQVRARRRRQAARRAEATGRWSTWTAWRPSTPRRTCCWPVPEPPPSARSPPSACRRCSCRCPSATASRP